MNALLVIGAGGHGRVVADAALTSGWSTVAFLDDRRSELGAPLGLPIVGTLQDLPTQRQQFSAAVVGIGDAAARLEILARCRAAGFELATVVHARACVSRFATIGPGSVVFAQAAVNPGAKIGEGCIINTGATVDHDCVLGDGVHICPGAHLGGNVQIADRAWIGIGAVVRQGIALGREVMVAAGATVVADVSAGVTVVGVPARQKVTSQ